MIQRFTILFFLFLVDTSLAFSQGGTIVPTQWDAYPIELESLQEYSNENWYFVGDDVNSEFAKLIRVNPSKDTSENWWDEELIQDEQWTCTSCILLPEPQESNGLSGYGVFMNTDSVYALGKFTIEEQIQIQILDTLPSDLFLFSIAQHPELDYSLIHAQRNTIPYDHLFISFQNDGQVDISPAPLMYDLQISPDGIFMSVFNSLFRIDNIHDQTVDTIIDLFQGVGIDTRIRSFKLANNEIILYGAEEVNHPSGRVYDAFIRKIAYDGEEISSQFFSSIDTSTQSQVTFLNDSPAFYNFQLTNDSSIIISGTADFDVNSHLGSIYNPETGNEIWVKKLDYDLNLIWECSFKNDTRLSNISVSCVEGRIKLLSVSHDPSIGPNHLKYHITLLDSYGNTLSVNDESVNSFESDYSVFPNPFQDVLTIEGVSESATAFVYDINGQLIKQVELSNKTCNLGSLTPGLYVLKICEDSRPDYFQKVVKN